MAIKLQGTNSVAAPGLTNDGSDGVVVGTDTVDISIGGASKVKVDSAGKVGIATTSPGYRIDIGDGSADPPSGYQVRVNSAGDYIVALQRQSTPSFSIRNNSTSIVHLNTQNNKTLALGVSSGNASGSIEEDVKIDSTGDLIISDGDLVIGTAGHGIDFSATSDATGKDNELLDDYEEGDWDPLDSNGGTVLSHTHGRYTKVGNLVHIDFDITNDSGGNLTKIWGLPFTPINYAAFRFGWVSSAGGGAQGSETTLRGGYVSTSSNLAITIPGGNQDVNWGDTVRIIGSADYRTS